MEILVSSIIGILALVVAIAGVMYAHQQVQLAKSTKTETEKLLERIHKKTEDIKKISEDTQKSINEQINTILKNFDPKVQSESKMMESLAPAMLQMAIQDPQKFADLNKMFNQGNK
jgi:uncharacterized protein HemX